MPITMEIKKISIKRISFIALFLIIFSDKPYSESNPLSLPLSLPLFYCSDYDEEGYYFLFKRKLPITTNIPLTINPILTDFSTLFVTSVLKKYRSPSFIVAYLF